MEKDKEEAQELRDKVTKMTRIASTMKESSLLQLMALEQVEQTELLKQILQHHEDAKSTMQEQMAALAESAGLPSSNPS